MFRLHTILEADRLKEAKELIDRSSRIVITCHVSPDGDALGSSLGLRFALRSLGKEVEFVTPDAPPKQLMFLPGIQSVVVATRKPELARRLLLEADLVFCLDFNALQRVDKLGPALLESPAKKILIDHHLGPEAFPDVTISHPEASSTSSLVWRFLYRLGWIDRLSTDAATCICAGMMTDTGNFSYNSLDPDLYLILSDLVARGVQKDRLYNLLFNTKSESMVRLNGYAVSEKMQIFHEAKTALIVLTKEELDRFGYVKGDTEGLVNVPLSIPGVVCSIFMRQDEDDYVKVSTRSRGEFPVNRLCELHFAGGGHKNAAGGEFHGPIEDAEAKIVKLILTEAEPWKQGLCE